MKLKLVDVGGKTYAEVLDGKPVYEHDDGKSVAFDYDATLGTITRLNGEAKTHRVRAEDAETKLKAFDGIEDPAAARNALETVSKLDSKKLLDAGKVDEIKAEAEKAFNEKLRGIEEKYKPVIAERDNLTAALHQEIVGGSFSRSKYIADKLAIPADLVQARFGAAFKVEDGNKLVGKDASGNNIFSRARPGEIASFDEALETLVEQYPHRDSILKGSGASGGGAGGGGTTVNGKRTMTRTQFDTLDPVARAAAAKDMAIVD